jgi:hypothetical protein
MKLPVTFGPEGHARRFRLTDAGMFEGDEIRIKSGTEPFNVLRILVSKAGEECRPGRADAAPTYSANHVRTLRQSGLQDAIRTVRGAGYVFTWRVSPEDESPHRPCRPKGILRHLPVAQDRLPRPSAVKKVKNRLLRSRRGKRGPARPTCLTAAAGMGGIGKTVLASLVMEDPEVQAHFHDGIIGLTIGRNPDPARLDQEIRAIPAALGHSTINWGPGTNYRERIEEQLADRSILLVFDDVWTVRDIESWRPVTLGNSAILITTRQRNLDDAIPDLDVVEADFLTPKEARQLLAKRAKTTIAKLPKEAEQVLSYCGYKQNRSEIPAFAVALAGSMVSMTGGWSALLRLFKEARINEIRSLVAREHEKYESIFAWIHVSVENLDPEIRENYLLCSAFKDRIVVTEKALQIIWGDLEGDRVGAWLSVLDGSCLLNWDRKCETVSFHDLHMDYLRFRARQIRGK